MSIGQSMLDAMDDQDYLEEVIWVDVQCALPPYNVFVLGIDNRGYIIQTRRTKAWDCHWKGSKGFSPKWQYWCHMPDLPPDVKLSYKLPTMEERQHGLHPRKEICSPTQGRK
ncbi:MAG: hypothetical protein R3230_01265 [Nitrosopumilaceae archaeon]|nr:hypothetical protein [Nitrosopumilaceae archaeon]